jgi:hypothetical protein
MYHPVPISELSPRQVSRLLNGHPVSVKPNPSGKHVIHASLEQVKKMRNAYKKGSGVRVMLDPYQQSHHRGAGFLGNMMKAVLPMAKNLVKETILPQAQKFVMSKAQDLVPSLLEKGASKLQSSKLGKYIPESVLDLAKEKGSELALSGLEKGLEKASDLAKAKIGSGLKRKKLTQKELMLVEHMKAKRGRGFLNDLLGNIPLLGPILQNLDNSIGSGLKKRRRPKRGRALMPAGY